MPATKMVSSEVQEKPTLLGSMEMEKAVALLVIFYGYPWGHCFFTRAHFAFNPISYRCAAFSVS
jgi:hypothetical protein